MCTNTSNNRCQQATLHDRNALFLDTPNIPSEIQQISRPLRKPKVHYRVPRCHPIFNTIMAVPLGVFDKISVHFSPILCMLHAFPSTVPWFSSVLVQQLCCLPHVSQVPSHRSTLYCLRLTIQCTVVVRTPSGGTAELLDTRWRSVASFTLRPVYRRGKPQVPVEQQAA